MLSLDDLRARMQTRPDCGRFATQSLIDDALPGKSFRRGSLVELLGNGTALAAIIGRESLRDGGMLVAVDTDNRFYPPAAAAMGIDLERLIVLQGEQDWTVIQALSCPAVDAVLCWPHKLDGKMFRRWQLAAERGGSVGLLVRPSSVRGSPSWADVQIVVEQAASRWRIDVRGQAVEFAIHEGASMIAAIRCPKADAKELVPWADQFSPLVGIELGTLLLDITGLPFHAEQVAKMIDSRVAVAETVGKAWARANYDEPLPVAALRLPTETIELLAELGLRYVADLQALPRDRLAARFAEVIRRLDQFTGILSEPITGYRQESEIVVERDLEYPIDRRDMLELICGQVVEQVAAELASRQHGAIRLEFALDETRFIVGLFQPSASARYVGELAQMQLERVKLTGPVSRVRVAVLMSARLEVRQRELFGDSLDRHRQLALFVDRISCRSRALRAVLVADAQPEHAFRYEPLTARKRSYRHKLPPRPLLLEPCPILIEAISASGRPAQFWLDGEQHRTLRADGPERIQTGWWRNGYIRRDYYRVETEKACYWLFRAQGKWYLHGVF